MKTLFDGYTATGVTAIYDGNEVTYRVEREVIVSQEGFETLKILMLSGIGPEEVLAAYHIEPLVKSAPCRTKSA